MKRAAANAPCTNDAPDRVRGTVTPLQRERHRIAVQILQDTEKSLK